LIVSFFVHPNKTILTHETGLRQLPLVEGRETSFPALVALA
jgi:hypothetical protein